MRAHRGAEPQISEHLAKIQISSAVLLFLFLKLQIFFAVSENGGKDNSGDYTFQRDKDNRVVIDNHGHPVIEHDLDEIADNFIEFAKKERLSFW